MPKCAGTSLVEVLAKQYSPEQKYWIHEPEQQKKYREFKNLSLEKRQQLRFITGHQTFGIHKYLPQGAKYFTLVRDPLERAISHYFHSKTTPGNYLYRRLNEQRISLEDYLSNPINNELKNGMCRLLTDETGSAKEPRWDEIEENLEQHFFFLGGSNEFDLVLLSLWRQLRHRNWPFYKRKNIGDYKQPQILPAVTEAFREHNELDYRLFDYVNESKKRPQNSFPLALGSFQMLNSVLGSRIKSLLPDRA